MKSAQYFKRRPYRSFKIFSLVKLFLVFLLLVLVFILFFLKKNRRAEDKILLVVQGKDVVRIVDFDFTSSEIVVVDIPDSLEVEASHNLGNWELSSIWNLGENEKIGGGKLLVETLRNNLFAPVYYFSSEKGESLVEGSVFSSLAFPFLESKSNLGLINKIKLAIFSARFKDSKLTKIDLSSTSFLEKTRLKSGKDGYRVKGELPQELIWVFAHPLFLENNVFVSLINETGSSLIVGKISRILETMGAKLGSVYNQNESSEDCEIAALNQDLLSDLSLVFSCREVKDEKLERNEIVLKIGKKFKERF